MDLRYTTTYKRHFTKRKIDPPKKIITEQEFPDPIAVGFKKYLVLDKPPGSSLEEDGEEYLKKFLRNDTSGKITSIHFADKSLNKPVLLETDTNRSEFTSQYYNKYPGYIEDTIPIEFREKVAKTLIELPDTTYEAVFKDPRCLVDGGLIPNLAVIPVDNLVKRESIREIEKLAINESEYTDTIGRFGQFIMDERVYGDIPLRKL